MWIGKFVAGFIGLTTGGLPGLVIGIIVGHYIDRLLSGNPSRGASRDLPQVQETFFHTVFLLMGRLAKLDGRISEAEIAHTERLMSQMSLHSEHRQEAIRIFKEGAKGDFDLQAELTRFRTVCARHPVLSQQLLSYLLSLSLADGTLSQGEEAFMRQVAQGLGMSTAVFDQLLRMIRAQAHFRQGGQQRGQQYREYQRQPSRDELALAYEALGATATMSDAELKKIYRKLMSENHPDKLTGQGVPEDMIKLATERTQEIQTAYDLIMKHRKP